MSCDGRETDLSKSLFANDRLGVLLERGLYSEDAYRFVCVVVVEIQQWFLTRAVASLQHTTRGGRVGPSPGVTGVSMDI